MSFGVFRVNAVSKVLKKLISAKKREVRDLFQTF